MNTNEIMDAWKQRKIQIEASRDLADKVMHRVHEYEQRRRRGTLDVDRLVEAMSSSPAAAAAAVALGAVAGIIRLSIVVLSFLAV